MDYQEISERRYQRNKVLVALMFIAGSVVVLAALTYSITVGQPTPEKRLSDYLPPNSRVVRQLSDKWFIVDIEGIEYYAYERGRDWFFTPKVNTRLVTLDGKFGRIVDDK